MCLVENEFGFSTNCLTREATAYKVFERTQRPDGSVYYQSPHIRDEIMEIGKTYYAKLPDEEDDADLSDPCHPANFGFHALGLGSAKLYQQIIACVGRSYCVCKVKLKNITAEGYTNIKYDEQKECFMLVHTWVAQEMTIMEEIS